MERLRHLVAVRLESGTSVTPVCTCGWEGSATRWTAEVDAQKAEHLRSVAALTTAGRQVGMTEADAESVADNLARNEGGES